MNKSVNIERVKNGFVMRLGENEREVVLDPMELISKVGNYLNMRLVIYDIDGYKNITKLHEIEDAAKAIFQQCSQSEADNYLIKDEAYNHLKSFFTDTDIHIYKSDGTDGFMVNEEVTVINGVKIGARDPERDIKIDFAKRGEIYTGDSNA